MAPLIGRRKAHAANCRLGEKLLAEAGLSKAELVPSKLPVGFTGFTYNNELLIGAPWPTETLTDLYVLAHEIGHLRLHVRRNQHGWYKFADKPDYQLEFEAEHFAIDWFKRNGLDVAEADLVLARANVADKIAQAQAVGRTEVTVPAEIADWLAQGGGDAGNAAHSLQVAAQFGQFTPRCETRVRQIPKGVTGRRGSLTHFLSALLIGGLLIALWARLSE